MIGSLMTAWFVGSACVATGSVGGDPGAVLARARSAMGIDRTDGRVLEWESVTAGEQSFQSDRWYPPFFSSFERQTIWYDPRTGAERRKVETYYPGGAGRPLEMIVTGRSTWLVRDTTLQPIAAFHPFTTAQRPLNPWAVLADWSRAGDVRSAGTCRFRDYPRTMLSRGSGPSEERLLFDPKTGFPVALLSERDHYLWGQVPVEQIWSNWREVDGTSYPGTSFTVVDGRTEFSRTVAAIGLKSIDSVPRLIPTDTTLTMDAGGTPQFLQPTPADTVRVGPQAYLLRNSGYTEAVALIGDTVFVFDATQAEERARQDSVWIGKLFPGRHPIVVVVTDLAWPHVAGIRFWVATGATIVSHRASEEFLAQVVTRAWTRRPDRLERHRRRMIFRGVDADARFAGGKLGLHPIDGIASEGALMAWLPADRFLWASDYIQQLDQPTQYLSEVIAAVRRVGVTPDRFAAQHVGLTPWAKVTAIH